MDILIIFSYLTVFQYTKSISLCEFLGRVVALCFIYTSCSVEARINQMDFVQHNKMLFFFSIVN